jgi:hypothetical protein
MMLSIISPAAFGTTPTATPTVTTLAISATSVAYQTPIILTATVTAGNSPITAGLVLFCEATAKYCENNSALGIAQLTFPAATASVKIGSGPIGNHSYKAVFRANNLYASSESNTVSYSVTGTYASSLTLTSAGSIGNYSLTGTVAGVGSLNTGPSGTISFLDTSTSNSLLGTENLVVATLSTTFVQNQPFAIGGNGTTLRSVAIASAYLNTDNNLDVVTGDAAQTISVLLGNGDGTFQPKVNYAGCNVGKALQIVLADFNRDGVTDIALGCSDGTNGGLVIILGSGDGTFKTPVYYPTGDVASIAIGDFNGDGLLDIALSNKSQQNVTFFLGDGTGKFLQEKVPISTPALAHGVVVADFNMDGKDDVAYAVDTATPNSSLSDLYLALGNGDGTFQIPTSSVATQIGEFLTAGDTNADDFPDVVSSSITRPGSGNNNVGNSLFVLLGNGKGAFQMTSYVSDIPSDPHLADVNGDGIPDIIAGGSTGALVYQGNGDGTFQDYQEPGIGGFALTYAVNAGDYNNDGNADLIGTDADTPRAAVSLSQVQQTSVASALTHVAVFPLGSGIHSVDASYSGDSVYIGSISATVPLTAAPVNTTLTLTSSALSSIFPGQSVVLTAMLAPYTVGPPTTTTNNELVTFFTGTTSLGSAKLVNGVATLTTTALPVGADALTAVFAGDSNYNPSNSNTVTATVSNVLLSSSPNPSTYLQSVTFTGVVPTGKAGTIVFFDGSTSIGSGVISGTTATFTTSSLSVGPHNITAHYNSNTSAVLVQVVNQATPTVTVTTSGPSTYGNPVTITATVPSGTTGTITITSGGVTLGSGPVNPTTGAVTISTTILPVGSDPITASYGGDTNNNSATGTTTQTVTKASPKETLSSSLNPSPANQSVVFTASLPTNTTGTVTFTSGSTALGTSTLANGVATVSTSTLPIGADPITATYNGDANNSTATATLTQTVNKATPTVIVTTSGSSTFGNPVTITTTVPPGTTGTITVTSGGTTLGSGTINPTTGTVTITTTTLPVGSDPITASYGGDTNDNPATGTTTQTVTKATPTVNLTSSINPSALNQSVTFTATLPSEVTGAVTFTNGSTVLGTVTLVGGAATVTTSTLPAGNDPITATYNGDGNYSSAAATLVQSVGKTTPTVIVTTSGSSTFGNPVTITTTVPPGTTGTITITSGGTTLGSGTVNPTTGTVTITTTTLPVGSDPITASYGGDTNNNPATGTTTQIVTKANPTVTLASSANPSAANQSVTFTASLPTGVTGTVTFSSGATVLGTSTLTGGAATISTSNLPIGNDPITASYNGDTNNNSASSNLTQVVGKATPVLPPPVVSSANLPIDTPETITEKVPAGVTGTVTFSDGATTLGTALIVDGVATLTVPSLPLGVDSITAATSGDANNNPAKSPPTLVTVGKTVSVVSLTSSINPAAFNQLVTFSASVHSGATGAVAFLDGSTVLGTGTLNAAGVATLSTSTLTIGSHPITASFGGDSNYSSSTSPVLAQVINKIPTTIAITESTPEQLIKTGITFTANVTASSPNATGTVTFLDGTTVLGTAVITSSGGVAVSLSTNANAALLTSNLAMGTHQIVAVYSGDSTFAPSTSSPANDIVEDFTNTNSGPASQNVFPGATTSYNFSLAPISATTFLNDVAVTVTGLPQGSTYTITPSTVAAGSGTTGVVLSVQTSSSLSARNSPSQGGSSSKNELSVALGMLSLLGIGTMRKLRKKMPRTLMLALLALGSLLPIAAISGCAGGYFTLTPTTYTVTVTGIEGTVQHAATATLIVQ